MPAATPLAGVRVLDLTRSFPGGYATLLLSDLGADVLKVEAPGSGDPLRSRGHDAAVAPAHVGLNRGKRSMTLDTRGAAGIDVLRRLVVDVDVLIDSGRPGAMEAAGFGYRAASEVNPRLVWVALTGFGADGPYASRPGHDVTFLGESGLLAAMAGSMPWMPEAMLAVPIGGLMAAFATASAVVGALRDGKGSFVDVSITDAARWMLSGMPGLIEDGSHGMGSSAGRRVYRCADGAYVTVAAAEPRTWQALCNALDVPDFVERLAAPPDEQRAMGERVQEIFLTRPAAAWTSLPGDHTIGRVHDGTGVHDDPHIAARDALVEVDGITVPATPVRLRGADGTRSSTPLDSPPALGADTDAALAAVGYSPDEISALRADGIV